MHELVTMIDGKAVTTSLTVAEGTGNDHASVIKLVRTYQDDLEEFGRVGFEIASVDRRLKSPNWLSAKSTLIGSERWFVVTNVVTVRL